MKASKIRRFTLAIAIAIGSGVCFTQAHVEAQVEVMFDFQSDVRAFHDKQGDVFIRGALQKVVGSDVTISEEGDGTTHIFDINKFSDEDRVWIRTSVASHKKWLKKKKAADKIIADLKSAQSVKVIKACKKLMSFGTAANHATPKLLELLKSPDEKVVAAALNSLSSVSKIDDASLRNLFGQFNSNHTLRAVKKRPEKFVQTLSRFEKLAIPYLRAIAFQAKLNVKPVKASAKPETLSVVGGEKSKIRIAACKAIVEIKTESAAEILLAVIEASEAGPAGKRDEKTIQTGLKAIGRLGLDTPEVQNVLKKYKSEFTDIVEKSMESLK